MTIAITLEVMNFRHSKDEKRAGLGDETAIHVYILKVSNQTGLSQEQRLCIDGVAETPSDLSLLFLMK